MFQILSFGLAKLNNAEVTGFFLNVQKAIVEIESEQLGLESGVMSGYNNTLNRLIDQVYNATSSTYTQQMQAADRRRDQIYRRILLRLQMVEFAEENSSLISCREAVQTHLLTKYGVKVTAMPMNEETAVLNGFINDLTTKLTEDDLEALGIESDISALTQANNAFLTAYNARSGERANGELQLTSRLRNEMYDHFLMICFTVQYNANLTAQGAAERAKACQDFISVLNVIITEAKRRYLQRTGVLIDEEEGSDDNTNTGGTGTGGTGTGGNGSNTSGSGGTNTGGSSSNTGSNTSNDDAHNGASDIPDDVVFPGM